MWDIVWEFFIMKMWCEGICVIYWFTCLGLGVGVCNIEMGTDILFSFLCSLSFLTHTHYTSIEVSLLWYILSLVCESVSLSILLFLCEYICVVLHLAQSLAHSNSHSHSLLLLCFVCLCECVSMCERHKITILFCVFCVCFVCVVRFNLTTYI